MLEFSYERIIVVTVSWSKHLYQNYGLITIQTYGSFNAKKAHLLFGIMSNKNYLPNQNRNSAKNIKKFKIVDS